jgi:hypothetical protein
VRIQFSAFLARFFSSDKYFINGFFPKWAEVKRLQARGQQEETRASRLHENVPFLTP